MPGPRINYRDLVPKVKDYVIQQQDASIEPIRLKFGNIGVSTVRSVLARLKVKGVVAQNKSRRWIVLVKKNGSQNAQAAAEVCRKKRRKKRMSAQTGPAATPKANGAITSAMKIDFLQTMAKAAGGHSSLVIKAILGDVELAAGNRAFLEALKK
ncbi:MAG: hypothetical protein JWO43_651 [Candidatus Adlerbacteria bacterium]|nr:hypothetical protein [Candidatus Adlerbacteria bacterium]